MHKFEILQRQFGEGRLSRREFLTRASALGCAAAVPAALWSAEAAAQSPKKGGRLRLGLGAGSTTDSLDPGVMEQVFSQVALRGCMRDPLFEYTSDNKLVGTLAERYEVSKDAKTWRIWIRRGVEFHRGGELTSRDVIASINHHAGEDSASAAKPIVAPIKSMKADGKYGVVFELHEGNVDFLFTLYDYHLLMMPANSDGTANWRAMDGTGPYIMESFDPGVRATFRRNPNYWTDERGHFDEVEILAIADVNSRTNALVTGQIDMMDRCDLKTVDRLARRPNIKIVENTGTAHYTVPMLMDVPPFDDNNVRMALKHGLNRQALVDTVLLGHGAPGNDHPIAPVNRYFNTQLPQRKYDPEKAKWHLKQAGLKSLSVELSSSDAAFAGAVDAAVLYKEHASKAGIDIKVVREPSDGYWKNVWRVKPWCFCYWSGRLVEDQMLSTAYAKGADWNDTRFDHARFQKLLPAARAELDENKRRAMYFEMQEIIRDQGGTVVPVFNNYVNATNDKLRAAGGKWGADYDVDSLSGPQRWWFA
ncbi:MAG: ABC transporter substrate-binding protein [Gammaproteobacteria bacterium]|nr:ABC transporter substrate-binding protein [Gammaproteobacteria bacterium]CAJ2377542.1 MAG: Peptide ABC transporter substrate-binding protein [Arenicellales bacterium IbO2]MDA7960995.1 ABC transporter substrate-binding protein [Gammaproteobacteria bacterium]MDA7967805.1 ABC transporter substrate-binding protein [Gammaproteobacteria bacterium]MDA7970811.1 ABC transporter substrate-binding protein [Gammaproteobacteria bacterium]